VGRREKGWKGRVDTKKEKTYHWSTADDSGENRETGSCWWDGEQSFKKKHRGEGMKEGNQQRIVEPGASQNPEMW